MNTDIINNPGLAYRHVKNIINGRWVEAEEYIKSEDNWHWYAQYFELT
jgi:hypothetical protein